MLSNCIKLAVSHAWQIAVLVALVLLLCQTVAKRRAHLAHLLWLVVILKCLAPPVWSSHFGLFCWMRVASVNHGISATRLEEPSGVDAITDSKRRQSFDRLNDTDNEPPHSSLPYSGQLPIEMLPHNARRQVSAKTEPDQYGWAVLGLGWLFVTVGLIASSCNRAARYLRRAKNQQCSITSETSAVFNRLKTKVGVRTRVDLVVTRAAVGPAVVGLLRPKILMPHRLLQARTIKQLEPIIAHELLHIRRGDLFIGMLQLVAQSLWWFNPLVWYSSRAVSHEAERCCDEEVLATLNCKPAQYADCLLSALELRNSVAPAPTVPGVRAIDITKERLERIMSLRHGCCRRNSRYFWATIISLCLIVLPGAVLAVADDPLRDASATAKRSGNVEVTVTPTAIDSDDETLIVIYATIAQGPTKIMTAIASEWGVVPGTAVAGSDSSWLDNSFTTTNQRGHDRAEKGQTIGHSMTVIERDEPISFRVCQADAEHDIVAELQRHPRVNLYAYPKISARLGQVATIKDAKKRPFVVGVNNNEPQVRVVYDGFRIALRPSIQQEHDVWLEVDVRQSHIRRVDSTLLNDMEIEVPEVSKTHTRLATQVPRDQRLILGGLKQESEGADSKSMLVVLRCDVIHPPTKPEQGQTGRDVWMDESWNLALNECVEISLMNSKVIRKLVRLKKLPLSSQAGHSHLTASLLRLGHDDSLRKAQDMIEAHLIEIERAYRDLQFFYHNLSIATAGRDEALQTWQQDANRPEPVKPDVEAQSREQYYFFRARVEEAKRDLLKTERQLRFLMGVGPSDGRVIRPDLASELPPAYRPDFAELLKNAISSSSQIDQLNQERTLLAKEDGWHRETIHRRQRQLQTKIADAELDIAHGLTDSVQNASASYALAETTLLQHQAASKHVRKLTLDYQEGSVPLDIVLDAQRRAADAAGAFHRAIAQYRSAVTEVKYRGGELLDSYGISVE